MQKNAKIYEEVLYKWIPLSFTLRYHSRKYILHNVATRHHTDKYIPWKFSSYKNTPQHIPYYITEAMLGQVDHGSNDINKFYIMFIWLRFKVTLQDIQYICSKEILMCELTNVNMCEIPLRRDQLHCDHQKLNLLNKTLHDNNALHLCLFFKRKLRFSLLPFVSSSFINLFVRIILLFSFTLM